MGMEPTATVPTDWQDLNRGYRDEPVRGRTLPRLSMTVPSRPPCGSYCWLIAAARPRYRPPGYPAARGGPDGAGGTRSAATAPGGHRRTRRPGTARCAGGDRRSCPYPSGRTAWLGSVRSAVRARSQRAMSRYQAHVRRFGARRR